MKLGELIKIVSESLSAIYETAEAKQMAFLLAEHVLNKSRVEIHAMSGIEVDGSQKRKVIDALEELIMHKPLQYVLGSTVFLDCRIKVNKNVLIPRPETEEMVQHIIYANKKNKSFLRIFDIGTGSGCIAIALKKNLLNTEVHACDISPEALEVAKENAQINNADVQFHQFDILDPLSWPEMQFEIIVSNPPYIAEHEKASMKRNVLDHEPHLALFVPDDDALKYYKAIADYAIKHLKEKGGLYLEINESLGKQTLALFESTGFQNATVMEDINGKDRFICCKKP